MDSTDNKCKMRKAGYSIALILLVICFAATASAKEDVKLFPKLSDENIITAVTKRIYEGIEVAPRDLNGKYTIKVQPQTNGINLSLHF